MASYLILGAGKFGRLAAERLTALDPKARLLVVDRDPEALKAARAGASGELDAVAAEAVSYLARHSGNFWGLAEPYGRCVRGRRCGGGQFKWRRRREWWSIDAEWFRV